MRMFEERLITGGVLYNFKKVYFVLEATTVCL